MRAFRGNPSGFLKPGFPKPGFPNLGFLVEPTNGLPTRDRKAVAGTGVPLIGWNSTGVPVDVHPIETPAGELLRNDGVSSGIRDPPLPMQLMKPLAKGLTVQRSEDGVKATIAERLVSHFGDQVSPPDS